MGSDITALQIELISQRSEISSQKNLMVRWFEMLMTEVLEVKRQNSELISNFKTFNFNQPDSTPAPQLIPESSIHESFPALGFLGDNHINEPNSTVHGASDPNPGSFVLSAEAQDFESCKTITTDINPGSFVSPAEGQDHESFANADSSLRCLANTEHDVSDTPGKGSVVQGFPIPMEIRGRQIEAVSDFSHNERSAVTSRTNQETSPRTKKVFRSSNRPMFIKQHVTKSKVSKSHTSEKPIACDLCSFRCTKNSTLLIHQRCHKSSFACDQCNYRTNVKHNFELHQRTHTGEKPFSCDLCFDRFSQSSNLTRHKRTLHTTEKPFACDQCNFRTKLKTVLQVHKRIHTGEKPFQCHLCDYRGSQSSSLESHRKHNHKKASVKTKGDMIVCERLSWEQLKQETQEYLSIEGQDTRM